MIVQQADDLTEAIYLFSSACTNGRCVDIIKSLLEVGCDINYQGRDGHTGTCNTNPDSHDADLQCGFTQVLHAIALTWNVGVI